MRIVTRLAVLSLVFSVLGAAPTSAHGHGLRERHRRDDPAKRFSPPLAPVPPPLPLDIEVESQVEGRVLVRGDSETSTSPSVVGQEIIPLPSRALPPEKSTTVPSPSTNDDRSYVARYNLSTAETNTTSTATIPLPLSQAPTKPPRSAPTPLDLSISHSLSSGCMIYLASLLSSTTFLSCLPLSLLLTTSSGYSTLLSASLSSGNYTALNNLLSYTSTPQPSGGECETYMSSVMSSYTAKSNCGADVAGKNAVALEAKRGIGNYAVIRDAQSLVDESGAYCYIEALASKRPDDLYLWGLASGISLPSSSTPTCSPCSRALLNTYTAYIPDTPTLNGTLIGAAVKRVNAACGQGFVNLSTSTSTETSSEARRVSTGSLVGAGVIGAVVLSSVIGWDLP